MIRAIVYGKFEWDARKDAANAVKHTVAFHDAVRIFDGFVVEKTSKQYHGERRIGACGILEGKETVVVYTWRNERRRIISARRARRYERQTYEAIRKATLVEEDETIH